jgi:hypothetical protein
LTDEHDAGGAVLRVLNFENRTAEAAKLISPEGIVAIAEVGFFRRVGDYLCFPRPKVVYQWRSLEGVPTDLLTRLHTLGTPEVPAFNPPSAAPTIAEIEAHWREDGAVVNNHSVVKAPPGEPNMHLFSVSDGVTEHVALYFTDHALVFQRLGERLDLPFPADIDRAGWFSVDARWTPASIRLALLYCDLNGAAKNVSMEVDLKELRLLPARLIRQLVEQLSAVPPAEARFEMGVPKRSYKNTEDFLETVVGTLKYVRQQLMKAAPSGFWNYRKDSREWAPKDEPHCGDTLYPFLDSLFGLKNIQVSRESSGRSGKCDFCLTGVLEGFAPVGALLELKKAHSSDLENGVTSQLPIYVEEQNRGIGIYGVLWFKGSFVSMPDDESLDRCIARLKANLPALVADVVGFDVSFKTSASKR